MTALPPEINVTIADPEPPINVTVEPPIELTVTVSEVGLVGPPGPPGDAGQALQDHIDSPTPHPVYDDGPSLVLFYENAKA